ncbi:MAG: hypothetical protein IJV07_00575 [Alphaproteobacteria bacterium]|nr:hypothetical protein [Alphaproteobacteria bacterium]
MAKSAPLTQLISAVLLIFLTAVIGLYFASRFSQLISGQPIDWSLEWFSTEQPSLSPFGEQAALQKEQADALQREIVSTLERLTGPHTVQATVRLTLDLEQGKQTYQVKHQRDEVHYTTAIVDHLSVTVLIDGQMVPDRRGRLIYQPRSKADMQHYTDIVRTIIGFDATRGDTLLVKNMSFTGLPRQWFGTDVAVWMNGFFLIFFFLITLGISLYLLVPVIQGIGSVSGNGPGYDQNLLNKASALCQKYPERAISIIQAWLNMSQQRKNPRSYTPGEQAAIVLLTLGQSQAVRLIAGLSDREAKSLGLIMRRLGRISESEGRICLLRFIKQFYKPSTLSASSEQIYDLITKSRIDGKQLYSEICLTRDGQTVWNRIEQLPMGQILGLIQKKSPETIALILSNLSDELSGRLLTLLPNETGARVIMHLPHIRRMRPQLREQLTRRLAPELELCLQQVQTPDKTTSILNTLTPGEKETLVNAVSQLSPEEARNIKQDLKTWSDLISLSDIQIKKLLRYSDKTVLAQALADTIPQVQSVFARQLPPTEWDSIQKIIQTRMRQDGSSARQILVKTAQALHLFG